MKGGYILSENYRHTIYDVLYLYCAFQKIFIPLNFSQLFILKSQIQCVLLDFMLQTSTK